MLTLCVCVTERQGKNVSLYVCVCVCVCVCVERACVPLPLWDKLKDRMGGPWRNCCQKGSRGVCGNQWDDGSGLSCTSHLESSPLISGPETPANQSSPANQHYAGWQNLSVQMSCRTRRRFELWMAALLCRPRPVQAFCGPPENPDCASEPVTLFMNCSGQSTADYSDLLWMFSKYFGALSKWEILMLLSRICSRW